MKYRIIPFILALLLCLNVSCLDDEGETGGKGVLNVTVNTSGEIWDYPVFTGSTCTASFSGDTGTSAGTWYYAAVGGDGNPSDEESLYDDPILSADAGDKIIFVYLYSALGDKSDDYAVLYRGTSSNNNSIITISSIRAGTYYVVAFYDYKTGGVQTNLLNRYDRYAIYTESTDTDVIFDTDNSTPYQDYATSIEITDNTPVSITLDIKRDWVLGKPKRTDGGTGRLFLKKTDGPPPSP